MSIHMKRWLKSSGGITSAIAKQVRILNLKPIKKIQVTFDPFHQRATIARDFLFQISAAKTIKTNPYCIIKSEVVCDRSDPRVTVNLENNKTLILKANNLTTLELLEQLNKYVVPLIPPEEPVSSILTTKSEKKKLGKKK